MLGHAPIYDLTTPEISLASRNLRSKTVSRQNTVRTLFHRDLLNGRSNSTSYLSMELVEGKSLRALLDEGLMPLRKIASIASQLADGLAKMHAAGIVHPDLKPENLMISTDGFLKLLNFGLAKMKPNNVLNFVPTRFVSKSKYDQNFL
jgi:serine/threonine protein kinase